MPPSKLFAVVVGVGPGTGAAVARRFARSYPVALLARQSSSYEPLVGEINKSGGKAIGISADVADSSSVKNAFEVIGNNFGAEARCAAAIFNASGRFARKPLMELTEDDFMAGLDVSARGAFLFAQACMPFLLRAAAVSNEDPSTHPPTLIFTGATASIKSNALMSSFSTGKYALRAFAQSIGKEFGPQGVHVAHAIIDGVIDIPRTKEWMKDAGPDAKISADGIADAYYGLHVQHRSCFTNEIDIRPFCEKW